MFDELAIMEKSVRYDKLEEIVEDAANCFGVVLSINDKSDIVESIIDNYDFNLQDVINQDNKIEEYYDNTEEVNRRIGELDEITVGAIEEIVEDVFGYTQYDGDRNLEETTYKFCEDWDIDESEINDYYGYAN